MKRKILTVIAVLVVVFLGLQFIGPEIKNPPVTGDLQAPQNVKNILQRACYDCHSNQTNLRWYDKIAPAYWLVANHIKEGRADLNFSNWGNLVPAEQKGKLWESVNEVILGAMPLKSYTSVHPEAKISTGDLSVLKSYLAGMVHRKPADTATVTSADEQYQQWQKGTFSNVNPPRALNGIAYIPDYKNWQPVSSSERFDNGTMRVIFGNDVAIKAIKDHQFKPWPTGTIFAKVAWGQLEDKDGNVRAGEFKQIEYMIKDDKKYANTGGWGWARFKTPRMVPYGQNIMFTNECMNCHQPVKDKDLVFTFPIKY